MLFEYVPREGGLFDIVLGLLCVAILALDTDRATVLAEVLVKVTDSHLVLLVRITKTAHLNAWAIL
jgi:hypothetical protein